VSGDDLSILIPVRKRPHRVDPVMDSIRKATPDAQVLFLCDPDDQEENVAVLNRIDADFIAPGGNYAEKINLGVELVQRPYIFLGADDLDFHPGWYELARSRIKGKIEVVGVNDLCSVRVRAGRHATHFLMTRAYATRGQIDGNKGPLCEMYLHNCTDDELVATATIREAIVFETEAIVEHLHPDNGKAPWDAIYAKGRGAIRADRRLHRTRARRQWK
jgi:glycosyltransferase involved in cell wall biosynthesis